MSDLPIKAASNSVTSAPFYLIQTNGPDKRYIVWLRDKTRIRVLLAGFINRAEWMVEVKIREYERSGKEIDYTGLVSKSDLHRLMTGYEDVLFHNGCHDLMIRLPGTDEYIVFDEHGLIFIYSAGLYEQPLANLDIKSLPDANLIYEFDHWHYCIPGGKEKLQDFIRELELEADPD